MRAVLFILVAVFGLTLTSCGEPKKDAAAFKILLETSTGQPHELVKYDTAEGGDYVVYKNKVTGEYMAYNLTKFNRKGMTLDQFMAVATPGIDIVHNLEKQDELVPGHWQDVYEDRWIVDGTRWEEWCECYEDYGHYEQYRIGQKWINDYYISYYVGGGYKFDSTGGGSKDLETIAAMNESSARQFITSQLVSQFSLSQGRADELAKLVIRYQKLESRRALTEQEKNLFAKDALGVSMTEIEKGLTEKAEGRKGAYEALLEKAAQTNKTTPEQIGAFFDQYIDAD